MSRFFDGLNTEQRLAVAHENGPLLVLAGAGSGKTRVITHRIARLIETGVQPWRILAVTFTNKAAGEMLERLRSLAGEEAAAAAWVSTFHAAGVRLLRREGEKVGLPRGFLILDERDQLAVMKRVLSDLGIGERALVAKEALARVDHWKNDGLTPPEAAKWATDPTTDAAARAYQRYQDVLRAQGSVDFGDLLLKVVDLFKTSADTRDRYRARFSHLLVDEFQDTNPVQYALLKLLCPDDRSRANLCVVGDDDQSIYRWRGAEVRNILSFSKDFPGTTVVKLERNYRSTPRILDAAHAVISKNKERTDKKLWTEGEPGDKLSVHLTEDDRAEAALVAELCAHEGARGTRWGEVAVFYRTNAQSRLLEDALRERRIPYLIVRGTSFYDRAEIRDVLAWVKLAVNPKSDVDFLRAVGAPPRGIGETTLDKLRAQARARDVSLWDVALVIDGVPGLNSGARGKIRAFTELVSGFVSRAPKWEAGALVHAIVEETGYLERLGVDPRGEGEERKQNVQELVRAAKEFDAGWHVMAQTDQTDQSDRTDRSESRAPVAQRPVRGLVRPEASVGAFSTAQLAALAALRGDEDTPPPSAAQAFLGLLAVLGDADQDQSQERVSLMTLHAAKGLEFDAIVMVGLEERIFPTARALDDEEALAEERRLCYVGLTRARKRIYLTLARRRALYGELAQNPPSPFLADLPAAHTVGLEQLWRPSPFQERSPRERDWVDRDESVSYDDDVPRRPLPRLVPPARAPAPAPSKPSEAPRRTLSRVRHPMFGEGKVLSTQGTGPTAKLTVHFASVGPKVIQAKFLEPME